MIFEDFFRDAKSKIVIVGTNALMPHLEGAAQFFADLLTLNEELRITILCESDSECFNQSLCTDTDYSRNRVSHAAMTVHRDRIIGRTEKGGLRAAVLGILANGADRVTLKSAKERLSIWQLNLRLPVNMIVADGRIWLSITTSSMPTVESYFSIGKNPALQAEILEFVDFYTNPEKGGKYLSVPGEELIQLYDRKGLPRGIFPRACFYTTEFERYSIWGFIFNRNGELLLHQRSKQTYDGRGLWDKSVGGHVNLSDSSTYMTAQRELVEEMFLPKAEYSKYIQADIGDIIHFGDWNSAKRPEHAFREEAAGLARADWIMFRATDDEGKPLTVTRISDRRIYDEAGEVSIKSTVFRSDVYLFIAPMGYLDAEQQMKNLLRVPEESGAAQAHKLVTVEGLRRLIAEAEAVGKAPETFTDDILFINRRYRDLLERFAEFVKLLSRQKG